jgi:nucleoside-diphosphate-sugar epimerase
MKTLIIGATGYVGSTVARSMMSRGHEVCGLARSMANVEKLTAAGIGHVEGAIEDIVHLQQIVRQFEAVVFCPMIAFEDEAPILTGLIEASRGSERRLVFTSGTGVLAIRSEEGLWDENSFAEDDPFPFPDQGSRAIRIKTEQLVRSAAGDGVHAMVVRPPYIWGNAGGILIWHLVNSAKKTGYVPYVGQGLNLYSNAHVDDVAEVHSLALERGQPGALYHCVCGEANLRSISEAVAGLVGCDTRSIDYQAACDLWGQTYVELGAVVNSRSRAVRSRQELGWKPRHHDLIEDIRSGSYAKVYAALRDKDQFSYVWEAHGGQ